MRPEYEQALEAASDALRELELLHLQGRATQADHDRIFSHVSIALGAMAVMQHATPRDICEQFFGYCPTDEEWREEILPRISRAAQEAREAE